MAVRHQIPYKSGIFFITITCARWLPLFDKYNLHSVIYEWFDYLKNSGHYINAFVIMPNHFHAIISFTHTDKSINKVVGDGKRFMTYSILKKLKELGENTQLEALKSFVNKTDATRNKKHEVFEPSFDWKLLESDKFMEQKLDYIHNNPIRSKVVLTDDPIDYKHSSARQYFDGTYYLYQVTELYEMKVVNLTMRKYGLEE
ncbi:MAG: transposase [Bacteroidetes bacterium]|nr:transposase [Bacteroidota bacterium]